MWRIFALTFLGLAQAVAGVALTELQSRLLSLAEVLEDLTGDEHAARKKLREKADEMNEEDQAAAKLLRELAQHGGRKDAARSQVFSSSSSYEESHVSTDGQGNGYALRHFKTCNNGVCQEHTERTPDSPDSPSTKTMDKSVQFADAAALDHELGRLRKQMRRMEHRNVKLRDFEDFFEPVGEDFWTHFRSMGNVGDLNGASRSESVSEETVMRNGHAVHRLRRCKNGKCHTTVEEGNLTKPATSVLGLDG